MLHRGCHAVRKPIYRTCCSNKDFELIVKVFLMDESISTSASKYTNGKRPVLTLRGKEIYRSIIVCDVVSSCSYVCILHLTLMIYMGSTRQIYI